jgi:DNA transformation protein and related proteins
MAYFSRTISLTRQAEQQQTMEKLRNLGPKSMSMLAAANIRSKAELQQLGAVMAYLAVKRAGCAPSLNLLWAIEGALSDRDWKQVSRQERSVLLFQLDDYERMFK